MYKRIVVPIDGSQTSTRALVAALQMARESAGSVRLIHVIEELAQVIAYDPYGAYPGDLAKIRRENALKILGQAMDIAKSSGVPADQRLVEAAGQRLAEVVNKEVESYSGDLIVLGTHGRRGIGRVLLGSGVEQIIRSAQVPVLVIRGGEELEEKARPQVEMASA
ncbi:MAG: universal stress protein [Betaproteobacteria bacterium]|nr:universal stress protein [Betaproteobacteria bacterium]